MEAAARHLPLLRARPDGGVRPHPCALPAGDRRRHDQEHPLADRGAVRRVGSTGRGVPDPLHGLRAPAVPDPDGREALHLGRVRVLPGVAVEKRAPGTGGSRREDGSAPGVGARGTASSLHPARAPGAMPALRATGRVAMAPDPDSCAPATRARRVQPTAAGPRYRPAHVEAWQDGASAQGLPSGARQEPDVLRGRVGRHRRRRWGREDDRGGRALELARLRAHRLLHDAHGETVVVRAHGDRQRLAEARRGDETDVDVVREVVAVVPFRRRGWVERAEPSAPRLGGPHGSRPLPHVSEGQTPRHERGDRRSATDIRCRRSP